MLGIEYGEEAIIGGSVYEAYKIVDDLNESARVCRQLAIGNISDGCRITTNQLAPEVGAVVLNARIMQVHNLTNNIKPNSRPGFVR